MMHTRMGWHFIRDDKLRDGSPCPPDWKPLLHSGPVHICESGLHFSEKLTDALCYAPGFTLCRVCCAQIHEEQSDKAVCRQRTILWRVPGERFRRVLVWWAYWCAERAKGHAAAGAARYAAADARYAAADARYAAAAAAARYAADDARYVAAAARYAADADARYAADAAADANAAADAAADADARYAAAAAERDAQETELLRLVALAREITS